MADVEDNDLLIVGELRSSCFHKAKHVAKVHIIIVKSSVQIINFFVFCSKCTSRHKRQ